MHNCRIAHLQAARHLRPPPERLKTPDNAQCSPSLVISELWRQSWQPTAWSSTPGGRQRRQGQQPSSDDHSPAACDRSMSADPSSSGQQLEGQPAGAAGSAMADEPEPGAPAVHQRLLAASRPPALNCSASSSRPEDAGEQGPKCTLPFIHTGKPENRTRVCTSASTPPAGVAAGTTQAPGLHLSR